MIRKRRNADLERELKSDLELEGEEQRERGLSSEEARLAALRAFGNPTLIREHTRAVWSWNWLENLLRDLRVGARTLSRSPGFSMIAVIVMALCIGAATSLFTVARSVLLRPLPFRDPGRLVMLYEHFRDPSMNAQQFDYTAVAPADYYDWRAKTRGFEDMAWRYGQFNLTGEHGELPEIVQARGASWNLFPLLGVQPIIGRAFTESDDRPDGNVLTMGYSLLANRYDSPDKVNAFNKALLERVRATPGVRAAAPGSMVPGAGSGEGDDFTIPEHPPAASGTVRPDALYRTADPGYFSALQIPLLRGRFFTDEDRAGNPKATIISRELAQQYFPGENPLGKHLHITTHSNADYEIVGVVADTLYQVGQPGKATMYFPILNGRSDQGGVTLVLRTASDPLSFSVPVQKQIAQLDPELPVSDVLTMRQIIEQTLGNASLSASLVLAFAVLSLMLASVGLYGVLSYLAMQRTGEIGIRMALGAQREQVLRQMLGDGLRPALHGLVLGLAMSAGAVRLIESMLYGTRPLDPAIFAALAATLLAVSVIACSVPAWRASRIDPMQALRIE